MGLLPINALEIRCNDISDLYGSLNTLWKGEKIK